MTDPEHSRTCALVCWAVRDHGLKSVGRAVAGLLAAAPFHLEVIELNFPEELAGQSILQTLRLEEALLAQRGWPLVEQRLAGRSPRVVVALDPSSAAAVDVWRAKGQLHAPLVGVLAGLRVAPEWARTVVNRLTVADTVQAEAALALGLPAESIVPCGIPVCSGFSSVAPDEKEQLRAHFGLPLGPPVVLVVTDGLATDQLSGALLQLSLVAEQATIMFDVARDDEAAELLRGRAGLYGIEARMFGKVEEAGQLWAAADLVVARHHLYVEQRALALRLPYVVLLPAQDPEREAARIYEERQIGCAVQQLATLAAQLDPLLDPAALAAARQRIATITRRSAASDIARVIAQVAAQAEQVLAEQVTEPAPPRRGGGPLELIGAHPEPEASADLDAAEAIAQRRVAEYQHDADLWSRRAQLAAQKGDAELQRSAEQLAERYLAAMHRALAELARLATRKGSSEAGARRVEQSFRRMEIEDALAELKRKMGRDD